MLHAIAPLGVSDAALDILQQALDLSLVIQRQDRARDPAQVEGPVHLGLLSAALKLISPDPEELGEVPEREGLFQLLTLAEDMARQDPRACGLATGYDRPDLELADLRRRARNALLMGREPIPVNLTSDRPISWMEARIAKVSAG